MRDYDRIASELDAAARSNGHAAGLPIAPTVGLRQASDIKMEPVSWLWNGWLAAGKLHMLGGVPGTGKTTIALSLASVVSKGGQWPDGTPFEAPGHVLLWSGEDDAADTLVPRLSAMGANLERIHIVSDVTTADGKRPFDPASDMAALIAKAHEVGDVRMLLIVDPVVRPYRVTTTRTLKCDGDWHRWSRLRRNCARQCSG